ncbi:MAG TPA: hypothetical protein VFN67_32875 [Polyangiales bacterium]|nr:hypothetical protein [Polyangiales bacterium]
MKRSLSLWVGLALAACGGIGQDRLITVGVRPTDSIAASSGSAGRDAGDLPMSGGDVTNQAPDGSDSSTGRGVVPIGASEAFAGSFASAGWRAPARAGASAADAGTAGVGGTENAGTGGARRLSEDECGAIPTQPASNVTPGRLGGAGLVEFDVSVPNVFTKLRTTLAVPVEPPPTGQIFIWAGIQPTPNGMDFNPIGNGALMSVLAWGPLCAPDAPTSYETWWTASMYSNISSSDSQYAGCHSGKVLPARPKQFLDIDVRVEGTTWVQKILNRDTMEASDFSLDLKEQEQGRVFFDIELQTSNKPTEDVIFTNTVLSMDMADPSACEPVMRGMNDFASKPRVSADGKHCCIDRIVLRAPRVMASTMDPP